MLLHLVSTTSRIIQFPNLLLVNKVLIVLIVFLMNNSRSEVDIIVTGEKTIIDFDEKTCSRTDRPDYFDITTGSSGSALSN